MGMKSGRALCRRTTDVLRRVMHSHNVLIYNYIDGVICVHRRENANDEFHILHSLFEFLGIPINPKKVVPPSRSLTCMGLVVDVDAGLIFISLDVDASLTGMGAFWDGSVYVVSRNVWATQGASISHLEMLNVLVALRVFGEVWQHKHVKFHVDNMTVVHALNNG